jgi:2-polyprenyl-6-methoxyphenol hydroxylase-like FAD-dependent oxidoreductase
MKTYNFAIVGAGIGGLSLAIAMQRKGFAVTVYENAPQIKPLGAGLGMAANAIKAFHEIGIGDKIEQAGKVLKSLERLAEKLGVTNNFSIHRADLHEVLVKELHPDTLQLNKGCVDAQQDEHGVVLTFHDGTSVRTDYMIACDGIHSGAR